MNLSSIESAGQKTFPVLIEIPKGNKNNKYEYDRKTETMVLDFVFENLTWDYNYGEIVGTQGGDGDALDAIVYSSEPLKQAAVVDCVPFGVMLVLDRGEVDDKVLMVPARDPLAEKYKDIGDFSAEERQRLIKFQKELARQKKKVMEVKEFRNKKTAIKTIEKSLK